MHERSVDLPILMLADFDPDGVNIFRCYRYGSENAAQRGVPPNPAIQWMGIKSSQIIELDVTTAGPTPETGTRELIANIQSSAQSSGPRVSMSSTACREPIQQLTSRDRIAAMHTLRRLSLILSDDPEVVELLREVQIMLMLGVKAETQWLDESGGIADWLDERIGRMLSAPA